MYHTAVPGLPMETITAGNAGTSLIRLVVPALIKISPGDRSCRKLWIEDWQNFMSDLNIVNIENIMNIQIT